LLGRRTQQLNLDVEVIVPRKLLHPTQRGFNYLNDCRDFYARVGAKNRNFFLSLFEWNGEHGVENERRDHGAVLAAAEADEPRARVVKVKLAQGISDFLVRRGCHWRESSGASGGCKGGNCARRVDVQEVDIAVATDDDQLPAIHEALDKFAAQDKVKAELVKLRYFVGMTIQEAAQILGISEPTAKRYWAYARAWLFAGIQRNTS
jgi:hypothetical protein